MYLSKLQNVFVQSVKYISEEKGLHRRMEGGAGVGGEAGEDTEKMWKYQWTMSPLLRSVSFSFFSINMGF